MRLHRSAPPAGLLVAAPVTALRLAGSGAWTGWWADDDTYYACRTTDGGAAEWYRGELVEEGEREGERAPSARPTARVLSLFRRRRALVLVGRVARAGAGAPSTTLLQSSRRRRA